MRTREAMREAIARGRSAGRNAASWHSFNGYTVPQVEKALEDVYAVAECPSWLSGEWAGESMRELIGDILDETQEYAHDDVMEAYEQAATDAFYQEIERILRDMIPSALDPKKYPLDRAYRVRQYPGVAFYITERATNGDVIVTMVGDDRPYQVSVEDITLLRRSEYCGGCGQIGCGCDTGGEDDLLDLKENA